MTPLALPKKYPDPPDHTVLVIPHAGGGASVANPLRSACPASWLVAGVMFGGRESRFCDALPTSLSDLVDDAVTAATELRELTGQAPLLVGQCSGALVGWLAAVALAQRGQPPSGLVMVSAVAPSWGARVVDPSAEEADFIQQAVDLGAVPAKVVALPGMLDLLLPALRADFAALIDWSASDAVEVPTLAVPALALFSPDDCPDEAVEAWREQLPELMTSHVAAGHFLLGENPQAVARKITEWLPAVTCTGGGGHAGDV